jgi:hypothetical protein
MYFAEGVVADDTTATKALALTDPFPIVDVFNCSLQLCLSCSFLLDLLLYNLGSFRHRFSSGHLFLHEP